MPTLQGLRPLLPLPSLGLGSLSSLPELRFDALRASPAPKPQLRPGEAVPALPGALENYRGLMSGLPETASGLDASQRTSLWNAAYAHEIAGVDDPQKLAKYDPTGIIGFCFGRSMAVQLMARQMGLAKDGIKKLFIVGDLRSGPNPEWRFHVASLVRGSDGEWYAIDPILDGPMTAKAWIATVQGVWDKGGAANLYLTPADTVIPEIHIVPEDISKESGERLIELSFNPAGRKGFNLMREWGPKVYSVAGAAFTEHFLTAASDVSDFDFSGITINGGLISYNEYFDDLLNSLVSPPKAGMRLKRRGLTQSPNRPALGLGVGRMFRGHDAP